jgi:hypothetical protein
MTMSVTWIMQCRRLMNGRGVRRSGGIPLTGQRGDFGDTLFQFSLFMPGF